MKNATRGFTRVLGERQGYTGLQVRDEVVTATLPGDGVAEVEVMASEWHLTPEEVEDLRWGGVVVLRVLGKVHPPIMMKIERSEEQRS